MRKLAYLLSLVCFLLFSFCLTPIFGQVKTISGTVIADEDASPLIGVTVTNKTTNKRTQTNQAGYFSIAAEKGNRITFSYAGYANKEIEVSDNQNVSVKLSTSESELGGVVVTAYGIKKNKRDLTYQAISVSGDEIASTKRDNFINSLAGRIPGAMITSTTGMPGASSSIILRGPTSIDGTNQPIFVVDGLIVDNSSMESQDRLPGGNANRNNDFGNRGMDINPEDIDNVTVLKGPEATALYGSDGSNGAIIITTKKGTKGRSTVSYNNSFRFDVVNRLPQMQSVFDQGSLGVTSPVVRTYFGQKIPDGTPIYDNIRNFFQTGRTQIHNLSIDGGTDVSTYRFTAGIYNNEGVVPTTGFKRYNFRLNTTYKLSSKFNVTTSMAYTNSRTDKALKGSGGFLISLLTWPLDDDIRVYLNPDGTRRTIRNDGSLVEDDNPFFDVNNNKNYDINDRLNGNFQMSYDPAKWINLTAIMGVDYYAGKGVLFSHPQGNLGRGTNGNITEWRQQQRLLNGTYRATLKKKFGNVNNTLIAAFTFDSRKEEVSGTRGERLFDPTFLSLNNTDPLTVSTTTTNVNFNRMGAFLNYTGTFKNFWTFTLSGRMDGSSRLIDPLNYNTSDALYYYYSAGTNLILTDLFSLPKVINFAKLRLSYATTGRDPSAPYVKARRFVQSNTNGGGFQPNVTQGNPDLRPEFGKNLEIGTEIKLLKGRIGIDFAYYDQKVTDQLISPRLSYASGAILQWINGGDVTNRGVELQITGTPIKSKNFNWNTTINFARNRNKILRMPAGLPQFYNSDTWGYGTVRNISQEGGNIFQLAGNRFDRNSNGDLLISPTSGLPLRITGSGIATGAYTLIGDRQPDFTMGLLNAFTYKNWSFSFLLDIRKGGDVFNGTEHLLYTRGMSRRTLDRETPRVIKGVLADGLQNTANPTPNTIVINPLFRSDYYQSGSIEEDFIERDINWLRMRDMTLSYKLPASLLKRQRVLKNASVFFTVTDAFMITNYTGADPATNGNNVSTRGGVGGIGMDIGNLATPTGYNIGINIQF
jgi:TonB-linked SusC/RagA family outer membrane protein